MEEVKTPVEMKEVKKIEKSKDDTSFERDVKMFLVDLDLLQKKYKILLRPIITAYGPDINLSRNEDKELIKK